MPQVRAFLQFVTEDDPAAWTVGKLQDDLVYLNCGGLEVRVFGAGAQRWTAGMLRDLLHQVEALGGSEGL
jgi:hypothetical protein